VQALQARVRNYTKTLTSERSSETLTTELLRTIALVVLGQILSNCKTSGAAPAAAAIKGGTAMRIRYGPSESRYSQDFDVARHNDLATFTTAFQEALTEGWGGFRGELTPSRNVSRPPGVPADYVMVAFNVKLTYGTGAHAKPFMTVILEVGADELEDTVDTQELLDPDVPALFTTIGLPSPRPLHVIRDDHQIAQKLHGVSSPGSERAHDLIDLQLLDRSCTLDDELVAETCSRLFRFRNRQSWPPEIVIGENWQTLYSAQATGLDVLPTAELAVAWANEYIQRMTFASRH
jgi:hypothetical protein